MKLLIGTLPIVLSFIFYWLAKHSTVRVVLHISAYFALYVLGTIISIHIYDVLMQDLVFMTSIHGILLNPFFLISGAYIGIYTLYLLFILHYYKYKKWSVMKCDHHSSVIHAKRIARKKDLYYCHTILPLVFISQ